MIPNITVKIMPQDRRLARSPKNSALRITEIIGTVATATKTMATGAKEIANAKKLVFAI